MSRVCRADTRGRGPGGGGGGEGGQLRGRRRAGGQGKLVRCPQSGEAGGILCERMCDLSQSSRLFLWGGGRLDFMFSAGRPFVLKDLRIPLPRFKDLILLFSLVWLLMPPKPFILLQRAMPRIGASRAESVKGGLKLGKTIAAGHQSYNLMLALQLGLR